jgi:hypothetical protein
LAIHYTTSQLKEWKMPGANIKLCWKYFKILQLTLEAEYRLLIVLPVVKALSSGTEITTPNLSLRRKTDDRNGRGHRKSATEIVYFYASTYERVLGRLLLRHLFTTAFFTSISVPAGSTFNKQWYLCGDIRMVVYGNSWLLLMYIGDS